MAKVKCSMSRDENLSTSVFKGSNHRGKVVEVTDLETLAVVDENLEKNIIVWASLLPLTINCGSL
ncbi:MAG: hypothetical protein L3J57_13070 [Desulfuromusa sp.]|nr:hypothetical protein [Desulfuromusa sp.]